MSTHNEAICGTTRDEGRLDNTKIEGHIGDLLEDIPVLVALVVIIGVECIYLVESWCKSLIRTRTHGGAELRCADPARVTVSSCFQLAA